MKGVAKALARRLLPRRLRRWLAARAVRATRRPPVGGVDFGGLRRLEPVSRDWGFDRGLPVDRYFIEAFLEANRQRVRGRVLEIDTDELTRRYGGGRVTRSDVLHVSERLPGVTMVGDLTRAEHIPSAIFDCVIVTQTLQLIYDPRAAVRTLHRILRPGGTALVTVPGMSRMTKDPDGRWGYFWGFTSLSALRLFEEVFHEGAEGRGGAPREPGTDGAGRGEVEVRSVGNVLAATAFLQGVAAGELDPEELAYVDPDYELLVTIRATRGSPAEGGP